MQKQKISNKYFFYLFTLLILISGYYFLKDYFGVIGFSFIVSIVIQPIYKKVLSVVKRKGLATFVSIIFFLLVIIIPLSFLFGIIGNQALELRNELSSNGGNLFHDVSINSIFTYINNFSNNIISSIPGVDYQIDIQSSLAQASQALGPLLSSLGGNVISVGESIGEWITNIILFFVIISALTPGLDELKKYIMELSPLEDKIDARYIERLTEMAKSMVKGTFIIAFVQGFITGLILWIIGVPYSFLITVIAIFLSIIPNGAILLIIPVAIVNAILGNWISLLILILGYFGVVTNVDNVLRPKLVSKEAYLPPALILLSIFAGLNFFGFLGFIYGPILMILITTTLEVYKENFSQTRS